MSWLTAWSPLHANANTFYKRGMSGKKKQKIFLHNMFTISTTLSLAHSDLVEEVEDCLSEQFWQLLWQETTLCVFPNMQTNALFCWLCTSCVLSAPAVVLRTVYATAWIWTTLKKTSASWSADLLSQIIGKDYCSVDVSSFHLWWDWTYVIQRKKYQFITGFFFKWVKKKHNMILFISWTDSILFIQNMNCCCPK